MQSPRGAAPPPSLSGLRLQQHLGGKATLCPPQPSSLGCGKPPVMVRALLRSGSVAPCQSTSTWPTSLLASPSMEAQPCLRCSHPSWSPGPWGGPAANAGLCVCSSPSFVWHETPSCQPCKQCCHPCISPQAVPSAQAPRTKLFLLDPHPAGALQSKTTNSNSQTDHGACSCRSSTR